MGEYIYLIGAEDVGRAASTMSSAAQDMQSAASSIAHSLECHQRFLDDWLSRLDGMLSDRISDFQQVQS